MLHLVGEGSAKIFGITSAERLTRQLGSSQHHVVADANAVLDDLAVGWVLANPDIVLSSDGGTRLAIAVEEAKFFSSGGASLSDPGALVVRASEAGPLYIRKLRRRASPLALSLSETAPSRAERLLFASVYKGVTDVVTKWAWPIPAYFATKLASAMGIKPNVVTAAGLFLTILVGWLFFIGRIELGVVAAWLMTFLDTVDGKLARVTVTSSKVGNWLDHGNDIVHPPLWWICLAHGLSLDNPAAADLIWNACWIILGAYIVGRAVEVTFHLVFGFNAYLFTSLDSAFRLIVARRNILLLIMTFGLLVARPEDAFLVCAWWAGISSAIQVVRIIQARWYSSKEKLAPWLA